MIKGDSDLALADFDEAIKLDDKDAVAYHRRGEIRATRDEFESALADLSQAIRLNPENGFSYYLRGVTRFELYTHAAPWIRWEDLEAAIADFGETIRIHPDWSQGYFARGIAWRTNGDKERAIADLLEAARLSPTTPSIITALKQLKPDYESAEDTLGKFFKWPARPRRSSRAAQNW
jgi:tetratricopeptide (TPR) repeat protein